LRNPDPSDDARGRLHQVLADFLEAAECGAAPDQTTLLASHPDVARELAEFITVVEEVEHYVGGLRRAPWTAASRSLGDYELLAEVGRGGMGVVFKARQKSLNRLVALKVMRGGSADSDEDGRRFRAEAEAAAHLDHPHIVPIYETGEHDGRPFFSMKLFEGGNLAARIGEPSANPRRAAELVGTIARAVHHAHQRGILHRDLKPSNILLDDEGRPHVADFGLAKWLHEGQPQTQAGAIVGTPAYMAPEQTGDPSKSARPSTATTASDVYGCGAILYTLLTSRSPFGGLLPLETLLAVREQDPQAPATLNPQIDRDLETICLKCLEKDPGRRYPSALALAEDLERWRAGDPIVARPIDAWERTRRWCRRNPLLAAMSAATALLVVLGVAMLATGYVLVSGAYETSERYRLRAEQQAAQLRERLYSARMGMGFRYLQRGELDETRKLLDEFRKQDDLKGFEWDWLEANASSQPHEEIRYTGHSDILYGATFSPDGLSVATCGADRSIQLWDPVTGANRKTLRGAPRAGSSDPSDDENCVRFSPDGRRLASGTELGSVRLWNLADTTWQNLQPAHRGEVLSVDFSRDGRWLVTAGADGIVRVWDLDAPGAFADFTGQRGPVTSAVLSPSGREVASVDKSGLLCVWDRASRAVRFSATPGGALWSVAYSPDGSLLATAGLNETISVWRTNTFEPANFQEPAMGAIRSVDFSPDGRRLVSATDKGAVVVWRVPEGDVARHFNTHQGRLWSARFAPDSRRLVAAGEDTTARIWKLSSPSEAVRWIATGQPGVIHVAVAPRGSSLVMSARDGSVMLGDAMEPGLLTTLPLTSAGLTPPVFSGDGSQLAVVGPGGRIRRWHLELNRELPHFDPPPVSSVGAAWRPFAIRLAYTADGRLLALRFDGRLWICDGTHWREHLLPCCSKAEPPLLSPIDDRGTLITCDSAPSVVRVWSLEQQRFVQEFSCSGGVAACSRDGTELAFGHAQGNISLVRLSATSEQLLLMGHQWSVNSLTFSPDRKTLASASRDGTVRLWQTATGQELFVLEDLHREVHSVAFSSDGRFLVAAGEPFVNGKRVAIYDSRPGAKSNPGVRAEAPRPADR
jgi:WD40 repeat protein